MSDEADEPIKPDNEAIDEAAHNVVQCTVCKAVSAPGIGVGSINGFGLTKLVNTINTIIWLLYTYLLLILSFSVAAARELLGTGCVGKEVLLLTNQYDIRISVLKS